MAGEENGGSFCGFLGGRDRDPSGPAIRPWCLDYDPILAIGEYSNCHWRKGRIVRGYRRYAECARLANVGFLTLSGGRLNQSKLQNYIPFKKKGE